MICDRCLRPATDGAHGVGLCPFESRVRASAVIDDQIEGGARFFENLGNEPVWIETKTQLARELHARGLEPMVRHVEGDQHVQRWVAVDLTNYDDPAVRRERQRAMAAWLGLTLEEYMALVQPQHSGYVVDEHVEQAPVIERYIRSLDRSAVPAVLVPRC